MHECVMYISLILMHACIYDAANFVPDERTDKAILGVGCIHDDCIHDACNHDACIHDACIHDDCNHDACVHDACIHDACIQNAFP